MRLQKTAKAKAELQPGVRTLGQRERTLLLMADGHKTMDDLSVLFNGEGTKIAFHLIDEGYLIDEALAKKVTQVRAANASVVRKPTASQPAPVATPVPADQFDGKRSLATTRMFLFDMVERMFTRRAPDMAQQFREALRNARDRESMLATAREIIAEVEVIAGHERADSISERIAMLLPVQD